MSRFTKTLLRANGSRPVPPVFIAWEHVDGSSDEATHAEWLGKAMTVDERAIFGEMAPGETRRIGNNEFFREY